MNGAKAIGLLLAGTVNVALRIDPDERVPACCNICCGPCAALKWLQDNTPDAVDHWLEALDYRFDWQWSDGRMNWSVMEEVWANGRKRGCASINGVPIPCSELRDQGEDRGLLL